jgi:hypothetical protein
MKTRWVLLILLLAFALGSCTTSRTEAGDSTVLPPSFPRETPSRTPLTTHLPGSPTQGNNTQMAPTPSPLSESGLQNLVEKAREDLAQRLSVPVTQISLIGTAEVIWPDSGLGCSQPGVASAQVQTPGYLILLGYSNNKYEYHANKGTYVTYCMNPSPPGLGLPDK